MTAEPPIRRVDGEVVYENPWMILREDRVRFPDGTEGPFTVVDKGDFSVVVPFDGDTVYLVRQYRYQVGDWSLEFPAGGRAGTMPRFWSPDDQPDPAEVAADELREEVGAMAADWTPLGWFHQGVGGSSQRLSIFLARDLTWVGQDLEPEEQTITVEPMPIAEVDAAVADGRIRCQSSALAWMLARPHLG